MRERAILVSLLITFFLGGLELTIAGTMGRLIAETFNWNGMSYLVLSSYLLGSVVGSFVFGYFVDRLGRKRTLEIGLLVFVLSSALLALSFVPVMVLILIFVQGFAIGGDSVAAGPMIVESIRQRAKAFVVVSNTWFLGDLVAAVIGAALTSALSYNAWRAGFAVAGAIVVPFAIVRFFIRESEVWEKYGKNKVKLSRATSLLSVLLLVSVIDTVISYAFPFVVLPDIVAPYLGLSAVKGTEFVDEAIIVATIASIIGGYTAVTFLIDKLRRKTAMIVGHAYMFLSFLAMVTVVVFKSLIGIVITFGALSFLSPLGMFAVSLVAVEAFPASLRGKVNGIISGVSSIFSAITPLMMYSLKSTLDAVLATALMAGLAGIALASLTTVSTFGGKETVEEIERAWSA